MKTAIVLGSTGLVGSELVKLLEASPHYDSVLLLNRRPSSHAKQGKVAERVIDFEDPNLDGISGDDLYCALGTTARKAGSEAAQHRVDYEYPVALATRLRNQGVQRLALVSSVGANAQAANFYLRTKGQLEDKLISLGFAQTVIARPSFLLGRRGEYRTGEEAAILLLKLLAPLALGSLRKYRPITADQVARSLVQAAGTGAAGVWVLEYDRMSGLK